MAEEGIYLNNQWEVIVFEFTSDGYLFSDLEGARPIERGTDKTKLANLFETKGLRFIGGLDYIIKEIQL